MKIDTDYLELELEGSDGKKHKLKDADFDRILLYFYPADNTPLCTIQGSHYSRLLDEFHKYNCSVAGISSGSGKSKCTFAEIQKYKHMLLADEDYILSKAFGVYTQDGLPNYPDLKIFRCTFIIDKEGNILRDVRYVNANDDAQKNLDYLKSIS